MANSIKIGNLDISYFKVGGDDCTIYLGTTLLYSPTHDYSKDYLTIRSTSDNNSVSFFNSGYTSSDFTSKEISYSTDSGTTWTTVQSSLNTPITLATLSSGDTLLLKGRETTYSSTNKKYHNFLTTDTCELEGNIMSMTNGDSFEYDESILGATFRCLFTKSVNITRIDNLVFPAKSLHSYCYQAMFDGCSGLTSANIVLPATTLKEDCYRAMFANCPSLTTVPDLPATTLASGCYIYMFQKCTALTTAPQLPALALDSQCYSYMFSGCISLTTAPELPATTLASGCYRTMFFNCTSLTTAPSSIGTSATTIPTNACSSMFEGCTSLTTPPELPALALSSYCYSYMFSGCISLTTAPLLPAPMLVFRCYYQMFSSCSSLNSITCLATDKSASQCTFNWVGGVASSGTFTKDVNTTWSSGTSGYPTGWTVVDYSG